MVDTAGDHPFIHRGDLMPSSYTGDADGDGIPDSNFESAQLNLNLVARWEPMPGTTLFLVYTRGMTSGFYDLRKLDRGPAEDVFLIKFVYFVACASASSPARSPPAGGARASSPTSPRSAGSRSASFATRHTGRGRFPARATRGRASSSSGWRRPRMAAAAPGACSPAVTPASSWRGRCTAWGGRRRRPRRGRAAGGARPPATHPLRARRAP